jgi:hypothetical protein
MTYMVEIHPLYGGWSQRIEPIAATLNPRMQADQVVVSVAIGREYFASDGTSLSEEARAQVADAVEEAMRALKAAGPNA